MEKKDVRIRAKEKRKNLSEEKRISSGLEIVRNLISNGCLEDFDVFLCYYPLPGEISILSLVPQLMAIGKKVAFPRVNGDEMDFYYVNDMETDFCEGSFHVMEPVTEEKADLSKAACFVPGLAFDMSMYRVGYGKGYYDRFFEKNSEVYRIGICANRYFIPEIDVDPYDKPMDITVTETNVYYLGY